MNLVINTAMFIYNFYFSRIFHISVLGIHTRLKQFLKVKQQLFFITVDDFWI